MLKKLWHEDARFVVITGAHDSGRVGAVGYDGSSFCECFTPREDILCMGTGDLFASALISAVMRGAQYSRALEIAVGFTYEAVRITAAAPDRRFYGMHFEQALPMLIDQLSALDES